MLGGGAIILLTEWLLHSCQLSRFCRDFPFFCLLSRLKSSFPVFFTHNGSALTVCPELVDTLQHSQDTFSNTRAFNINC